MPKFTGHERDYDLSNPTADTYLDYMHARYYDSRRGRFLSVDPMLDGKAASLQPQIWNRYAYVRNSPVGHSDPTGKCADAATCALEFLIDLAPIAVPEAARSVGSVLMSATQKYALQRESNFKYAAPHVVPALSLSEAKDDEKKDTKTDESKAGAQDKKLTGAEADALGEHVDIHELKEEVTGDSRNISKYDLYKDKNGEIYVKRKNDSGKGEWTGFNINDLMRPK